MDTNNNTSGQTYGVEPNSPDLDSASLTAHMPALSTIEQAINLVNALDQENLERSKKNARIMSKYNAERPYDPSQLRADGLAWRSNFSTKPLATLIDKVVPRFTTATNQMRYLTASKLPDQYDHATEKTDEFRKEITQVCRAREGWSELVTEVAMENALFGFTAVAWLSPYSWFPEQFRQDDFLVPQGTKHTAKSAPLACLRQRLLPHELFEVIQNKENAQLAGWDVDNVVDSINTAMPDDRRSGFSDYERRYADLQRECAVITSFSGAKQIAIWHVFIAEVDGKISHVAFDNRTKKKLFWKLKQFDRMADVTSLYSFQHGNGTIHSSKGVGRELYAMAGVIDRSRNEVVDRLQLSGKILLTCSEKDIRRFRMSVVGSCILIDNAYEIGQQSIQSNVEDFFQLDNFLQQILDQIAGSTSPKAFEGDRVTKAAVDLYAAREEERRDALIERFLIQYARMVTTTQKRLCDPETVDQDAKDMQQRLLKVMSPDEMAYLANQPAVSTIEDFSETERQQVVLWAQEARGNPLYNQREVELKRLSAQFDSDFANSVLLPENDPTEQAEQTRQQQMEVPLLQAGQQVPVSPRDNHVIHAGILRDIIMGMVQGLVQDPTVLPHVQALAAHVAAHIAAAEQGGQGQQIAQIKQWAMELGKTLQNYVSNEQQAQAQSQGAPPAQPGAAPAPAAQPAPA